MTMWHAVIAIALRVRIVACAWGAEGYQALDDYARALSRVFDTSRGYVGANAQISLLFWKFQNSIDVSAVVDSIGFVLIK